MHILPKFLSALKDDLFDESLLDWIGNAIMNLLAHQLLEEDLTSLTDFLISTLEDTSIKKPTPSRRRNRATSALRRGNSSLSNQDISSQSNLSSTNENTRKIITRNMILEIIGNLMIKLDNYSLFYKVITPYWIFLFIDRDQNEKTITLALKILVLLLQGSKNTFTQKFINSGGFNILEEILPKFSNCTSVYYLLICLFVGKSPADLPVDISSLQLTYSDLFITFKVPEFKINCQEALNVLMAILRKCCAGSSGSSTPFTYKNYTLSESLYTSGSKQISYSPTKQQKMKLTYDSDMNSMINDVDSSLSKANHQSSSSPNLSKNNNNSKILIDNAMQLKRWVISDNDVDIQKAIIQFTKYLFDNCTEFQEIIWNDKKTDILRNIVYVLFPNDSLNYPCDTSLDTIKKKEEEKCHISASYMFNLLSHFLITSNAHQNKLVILFEKLFDCVPIGHDDSEILLYQTKLIFDFLTSAELSVSQQLFQENKTVANNIAKFCSFIIDRICAGILPSVGREFFDFLIILLERIEGITETETDFDERYPKTIQPIIPKGKMKNEIQILYKSLNRITIYLLYAPFGKSKEEFHTNMLHVINNIRYHHKVVLNNWNNDTDFINVLCQLLYNFLLDDNQKLRDGSMNVWKLLLLTKSDIMNDILINNPSKVDLRTDGFDLLLKTDFQTFDVFTFWLGDALQSINSVLAAQAGPIWQNYKENENKLKDEKIRQLRSKQIQLQSKREKREKQIGLNIRNMFTWRKDTITTSQEKTLKKSKLLRQDDIERSKFMKSQWEKIKTQLERERGVWGSLLSNPLSKYKLDKTEGPFRMRKKEKQNYNFYNHYPYVSGLLDGQHSTKIPTSLDCKLHYELYGGYSLPYPQSRSRALSNANINLNDTSNLSIGSHTPKFYRLSGNKFDDSNFDEISGDELSSGSGIFDDDLSIGNESENDDLLDEDPFGIDSEDDGFSDEYSEEEMDQNESKINRLLDTNEKILSIYNCERVDGMIKRPGIFLICSMNIYIIDNYKLKDDEIIEIDIKNETSSPTSTSDILLSSNHSNRKWPFTEIRDVFKRRYLLRPVALEIFSSDGRNILIVFELNDITDVYRNLSSKITRSNQTLEEISGNQIGSLLSLEEERFGVMRFWKKDMTQKWVQGKISNFQYLMHINMLAGRSYNDLTQYPVFPWVLADYESSELHLDDENIYRDLSKPMGALSPLRAGDFQQRYETWIPRENEGVPKWHYGSHYSSAGIVLYYLIRQEPFTQQFLNHLQSGRFDVADRLFHSIRETWLSASGATVNMADVKELIPEFYYLPEFLMNRNNFDLGKKQTGEILDNVVLPPWSKGDPLEFIRLHRLALESEYVSSHLHEWIDLIFGYKQQGKRAEEALNVFYFLTYEGSVDIDAIDDPIEKDSVIAQINNFGQTPKQIFKKPHPPRQLISNNNNTPCILDILNATRLERGSVKETNKSIKYIQIVGDRLICASDNRICFPTKSFNKFISWGFLDFSIRISYIENDKISEVIENAHDGQVSCLCVTSDGSYILTGGTDSIIAVRKIKKTKGNRSFVFLKSLTGSFSPISCIAASRSYSIIVSSTIDNTIILWDLNRLSFVKKLSLPDNITTQITKISINDLTGNIVAVSGSSLILWTINGHLITAGNTSLPITSFTMTIFNDYKPCEYITGHTDGSIKLWNVQRVNNQHKFVLKTSIMAHPVAVTALHIPM